MACHQSTACKSHLDQATEAYKQNRYTVAVEEYQAAYVLQPYPPFLYNIARLHHKQNHLSEAVAYYQRYVSSGHPAQAERARQYLLAAKQALDAQSAQAEPPRAPLLPEPPIVPSRPAPALGHTQEPTAKRPIHKQWWLWTIVGVAVAGAATALGIGIYARGPDISGLPMQTASLQD